jgi:hypothetical protein
MHTMPSKRKTPDGPRKRRGPPLIGSERRKVSSIRIEPSLERYAIETWGGLSTAVHELLSAHRALAIDIAPHNEKV